MTSYSAFSSTLDDAEKLIRILALVIGAIWAYFKFVKGRTFRPRLELEIDARAELKDAQTYIYVTLKTKNVGLAKIDLRQEGTALIISSFIDFRTQIISSVEWTHQGTFGILKDHQWIEPSELICEQHLFVLGHIEPASLRLEYKLTTRKVHWTAMIIIPVVRPTTKEISEAAAPMRSVGR